MSDHRDVPYSTTRRIRDDCLCLHAQRAARALARRFDEAMRPLGLKIGQFTLLNSLNRPEPPSMGAVALLLAMDRTTLTANFKPLEGRGLVEITADENDRRTRRLRLTDAGRAVLKSAVPIWERTNAKVEQELERGVADRLRADLEALACESD